MDCSLQTEQTNSNLIKQQLSEDTSAKAKSTPEGLELGRIKKKTKEITMRMSLQYSLVNQVLYAMDATITAKSLEWRQTHIREKKFPTLN